MAAGPRLTIGLPVYNGERYLEESMEALLGQTYTDFELIICDNASTDSTPDISRRYEQLDRRVRYVRQAQNIGAAPNHNYVVSLAEGEFFKWASADDLYARDLVERCIEALDVHPDVVLAHCWTAAVDEDGRITQASEYPLTTDSPSPPERFRSMLFGVTDDDPDGVKAAEDVGAIRADDCYGVVRTKVIQSVAPHDSYYYADRTFMTEIALHGRFHQTPEWLYFRRDHRQRAQHVNPTVRSRCVNLDPRRADPWRHPTPRLLAEYLAGYVAVIRRAPLTPADRRACYGQLARWLRTRGATSAYRLLRGGGPVPRRPVRADPPDIPVDALVAGREGDLR